MLARLHGKTLTGALLGAYPGVELAKSHVGHLPLPAAAWTLTDAHGIALGAVGFVRRDRLVEYTPLRAK